jgi:hypothetical protein
MMKDTKSLEAFKDLIQEEINKILKELQLMRALPAKVVLVNDNGTVNIKLVGSEETLTNIKNKSGTTLVLNDIVYIYAPTGSLTNCYVGVKF